MASLLKAKYLFRLINSELIEVIAIVISPGNTIWIKVSCAAVFQHLTMSDTVLLCNSQSESERFRQSNSVKGRGN